MKRDWNIIKFLLEEVEKGWTLNLLADIDTVQVDDYLDHIQLLEDASLVKGLIKDVDWGEEPLDARLTMEGHDLLEVLRDETVQRAIKNELPLTFVGLIEYARRMVA